MLSHAGFFSCPALKPKVPYSQRSDERRQVFSPPWCCVMMQGSDGDTIYEYLVAAPGGQWQHWREKVAAAHLHKD